MICHTFILWLIFCCVSWVKVTGNARLLYVCNMSDDILVYFRNIDFDLMLSFFVIKAALSGHFLG